MAMSETMPNPTDWVQFYQQNNLSGHPQNTTPSNMFGGGGGGRVSEATAVTTTVTSPTTPSSHRGQAASLSPTSGHLSPDGRVTKPVRRRSRASRRTPTTILNTDTTNFRAMVQQFTGGPSGQFVAPSQYPSGTTFNFGQGNRPQLANPAGIGMMGSSSSGIPSAYTMHQFQQQQQPNQQYMFSSLNRSQGEAFLRRVSNSSGPNMEVFDGFVGEGISTSRPSSSNENRTDNNYNML